MLQQILRDMYVDPDVLQALSEEQKKTLFAKMRQEQVRRWKEREDVLEREGASGARPKPGKAHCKRVSWLLGRDGDVHVCVIGEMEELKPSKPIHSELGERKGSSDHKATRSHTDLLKSNVGSRASSAPAKDQRDNLPPVSKTGVQLNLREVKSSSDTAKLQHSDQKDSSTQTSPHRGSRPISNSDLCHLNPGGRHHGSLPIATKIRPQDSLQQHCDRGPMRTFRLTPASRRGLEGAVLDGEGDDVIGRGRVAELMKAFSAPSNKKLPPPLSKPAPLSKPSHLPCPSVRS